MTTEPTALPEGIGDRTVAEAFGELELHLQDLFGREIWVAERIRYERELRNWSQARLSKEMHKINFAIHQSAISKIESTKRGIHRDITVTEALGFAKVFGRDLRDMVMPPGWAERDDASKAVLKANELVVQIDEAEMELDRRVNQVVTFMRTDRKFASDIIRMAADGKDQTAAGRTMRRIADTWKLVPESEDVEANEWSEISVPARELTNLRKDRGQA